MPGQLSVTVVAAKKLKGGDFFGKADPYVTIYIEHKHKKKTTVKKNAGSNAEWNETLVLDVTEGHQLYVEVFDKDLMNDELIGGVVVDLQPVFTTGRFDQWLTIRTSSGKISGEVHLIIIFYNRDQATGQSGGYYASQPAGNYQALPPQSGGYTPPPGPPPQLGGYAPPPGPPPQSGGYAPPPGPPSGGYPGEKNDYTSLGPRAGAIPQGYGTGAPPPFDPSSIPPINYIPGAPGAGTPMPGGYAPPPGPPPQSGGYAPPPGPPPQSGGYVPPPGPPPQSGGYAPPPEAEEKKHNVPAWAATAGVAAAAAGLGFLGTKIYEEHKHEKHEHEHEYKHQQEYHQEPYRHDSYKHNRRGDEYWQ